jgi:hypothetical protein
VAQFSRLLDALNARVKSGLPEGTVQGVVPAYVGGPKGEYPLAKKLVDGRTVGEGVKNTGSIRSTFNAGEYEALPGIREVPLSEIIEPGRTKNYYYAKDDLEHVDKLAAAIKRSGRIDPLIVVLDETGPSVLEGGHRSEALHKLGAKSFPALVVKTPGGKMWSELHPGAH